MSTELRGIIYAAHKDDIDKILNAWETSPMVNQNPRVTFPPGTTLHVLKQQLEKQLKNASDPQAFMDVLRKVQPYLNKTTPDVNDSNKRAEDAMIAAIVTSVTQDVGKTEQQRMAQFLNESAMRAAGNAPGLQGPPRGDCELRPNTHVPVNGLLLSVSTNTDQFGGGNKLSIAIKNTEACNQSASVGQKNDALVIGAIAAYGIRGNVNLSPFDIDKFERGREYANRDIVGKWTKSGIGWENYEASKYYDQYKDLMTKLSDAGLKVNPAQLALLGPDADKLKDKYQAAVDRHDAARQNSQGGVMRTAVNSNPQNQQQNQQNQNQSSTHTL